MTTTATYDELRERVLAGDTTVTPKKLADAKAADELAGLTDEAERLAAAEEQRAKLEADRADFIDHQTAALTVPLGEAQEAYTELVVTAVRLAETMATAMNRYNEIWAEGKNTAKALGVTNPGHRFADSIRPVLIAGALSEAQGLLHARSTGRAAPPPARHLLHSDEHAEALRAEFGELPTARRPTSRPTKLSTRDPKARSNMRISQYEDGVYKPPPITVYATGGTSTGDEAP